MPPLILPLAMFAAMNLGLSMIIAVLRHQHNLLTGHRLGDLPRLPVRQERRVMNLGVQARRKTFDGHMRRWDMDRTIDG